MSKEGINKVRRPRQAEPQGMTSRQRASYTLAFKLECVRYALSLPVAARIKPTCRRYPGIEPVQIRKWIKNFQELACRSQGEAHSDVRSCSEVVRLSRGSSEASTPPGKEEAPDSRPRSPVVAERVEKLTKDFDWPLCAMSDAACPAHAETRSSSATSLACNATLSAGSSTRVRWRGCGQRGARRRWRGCEAARRSEARRTGAAAEPLLSPAAPCRGLVCVASGSCASSLAHGCKCAAGGCRGTLHSQARRMPHLRRGRAHHVLVWRARRQRPAAEVADW